MATKPVSSDAEFFAQRGFGQKLGFGLRPALLIVDMVKAFTNPDMPLGANLESQIAAIQPLLKSAHDAQAPVIFSTVAYEDENLLIGRQSEEEERALIAHVVGTIRKASRKQVRGWLSPALSESHRTLDLLAENRIEYVANWVNDEQPYPMRVKNGSIISIPYSIEINDIPAFLDLKQNGETFGRMICDQFDGLYEDGAKTGRVMAISLHPFLIGHPHRNKYFAQALAHIASRQEVWITTGSEIVDWHRKNYLWPA